MAVVCHVILTSPFYTNDFLGLLLLGLVNLAVLLLLQTTGISGL